MQTQKNDILKHGPSDGNSMEEDEDIETQERLEAKSDGFKKWMLSKRANGKTKAEEFMPPTFHQE